MRTIAAALAAFVVGLRSAWIATATLAGAVWPVAALAAGGVAVTAAGVGMLSVGPGYVANMEDISCSDAGTLIQATCGQQSLSCECSAATLFGSDSVVPLTGRAETNFDANVRKATCRSQANTTCDCWALCSSEPD